MGTNGLSAVDTLKAREKCPEKPTKRKFKTRALADEAAREASATAKMAIVPYACPGCGYFHLTRKVDGSDIVHDDGKPITTRGMRSRLRVVERATVERSDDPSVYPPGDAATRDRVLGDFIAINPGPLSTATVMEVLDCGIDTARDTLRRAGYTSKRGPGAKWAPPEEPAAPVADDGWRTPSSFPSHVSIADYVAAMSGVGLAVRIQVKEK